MKQFDCCILSFCEERDDDEDDDCVGDIASVTEYCEGQNSPLEETATGSKTNRRCLN